MTDITYSKLFNNYTFDYSKGLRSWDDLVEAITRLNVRFMLDKLDKRFDEIARQT